MDKKHVKFLARAMVIAWFAFLLSSPAMAGIVIENYNQKLNGIEGIITETLENQLTLFTDSGRSITLKVKGLMENNEATLKVGDRVKIQDGEIAGDLTIQPGQKVHFDPQPEPPGKVKIIKIIEETN